MTEVFQRRSLFVVVPFRRKADILFTDYMVWNALLGGYVLLFGRRKFLSLRPDFFMQRERAEEYVAYPTCPRAVRRKSDEKTDQ